MNQLRHASRNGSDLGGHGQGAQDAPPRPSVTPSADTRTEQDLHTKLDAIMARMDRIEAALERRDSPSSSGGWFDRAANGSVNGTLGLVCNVAGACGLFVAALPLLLQVLFSTSWRDAVLITIPLWAIAAAVFSAALIGRSFPRRLTRMRFMYAAAVSGGAASVLYLIWLSVRFLTQGDPGGYILAVFTWAGILYTTTLLKKELKEMRQLISEEAGMGDEAH